MKSKKPPPKSLCQASPPSTDIAYPLYCRKIRVMGVHRQSSPFHLKIDGYLTSLSNSSSFLSWGASCREVLFVQHRTCSRRCADSPTEIWPNHRRRIKRFLNLNCHLKP